MFSAFRSIFLLFFCLNLVSSQENPVIKRNDTRIDIFMKTVKIDRTYNINSVCDDYSTVPMCINDQIDITCPIDPEKFRREYQWTPSYFPFPFYMTVRKETKTGLTKLQENLLTDGSIDGIIARDKPMHQAASDPCYFCWFHWNNPQDIPVDWKQRSKAVRAEIYDCEWLDGVRKISYIRPVGTGVSFTCWDTLLRENTIIEWYWQSPTDNRFSLLSSSDTSNNSNVYELNSILKGDAGSYVCYVWFRESRVRFSRQFELRLAMPPLRPIKLVIVNVRDTSVTMKLEGNASNSKYVSADSESSESFRIRYYPFEKSPINQSVNATTKNAEANLTGLAPFTLYVVELRAVNSLGESEPIYNVFLTKNSSSVGRPFDIEMKAILNEPMTLKCYNYQSASQNIEWWKLYRNRFDSHYDQNTSLYVIQKIEPKHAGLYKCRTSLDGIAQIHNISNLSHDFLIQLSIVMPPFDPKAIRCENDKPKSLAFTWTLTAGQVRVKDDLLELLDLLDTTADSYKLKYKQINSDQGWSEKILPANDTKATVENLESESYYSIRLSSLNKAGESKMIQKMCKVT